MKNRIELNLSARQIQRLSPQMLQSSRILQMDTQELRNYINTVVEENPVLEKEPENHELESDTLYRRLTWLGSIPRNSAAAGNGEEYTSKRGIWDNTLTSVQPLLLRQLEQREISSDLFSVCKYLVKCLDENGYLDQEDMDDIEAAGISHELVAQAVATLQDLEPAGIAARNLKECLLLQLRRLPQRDVLAERIVETHLEDLGDRRWRMIAKSLQTSEEAVQQAAERIRTLSPRPGHNEQETSEPNYIIPDVFVAEQDGQLSVFLNDRYTPRIYISDYYVSLLQKTEDSETKEYLLQRIQQAKWIIDCLQRRHDTLLSCAHLIFSAHKEFFQGNTPYLAPMTQKMAAGKMGIHESTLGRCIKGKYLQCRQGTFPLQHFFPHPVGNVCWSEQALRWELMTLIDREDRTNPLSDEQIHQLLAKKGIAVARRTVSKYRQKLKIPPAFGRKNWQSH